MKMILSFQLTSTALYFCFIIYIYYKQKTTVVRVTFVYKYKSPLLSLLSYILCTSYCRYEAVLEGGELRSRLEGITHLVEHPIQMKPPGTQAGYLYK